MLFPEGGGQPRDCGTINGIEVVDVQRRNGQCVHTIAAKFEAGQEVDLILNWDVRFDRMQHHSGLLFIQYIIYYILYMFNN